MRAKAKFVVQDANCNQSRVGKHNALLIVGPHWAAPAEAPGVLNALCAMHTRLEDLRVCSAIHVHACA